MLNPDEMLDQIKKIHLDISMPYFDADIPWQQANDLTILDEISNLLSSNSYEEIAEIIIERLDISMVEFFIYLDMKKIVMINDKKRIELLKEYVRISKS